jgi:DNA repair protein RadA/Sms
VIRVEGDRHSSLRLIRALKHRFGPTGELGLMEMTSEGLSVVADPSRRGELSVPGVVATVTNDGSRSFLVEVQALVSRASGSPRRVAYQLSSQRLALLLAVLEARGGIDVTDADVFAATAGGLAANEPAADLAIALAVASVARGVTVPSDVVVVGEIGLAGEIRPVGSLSRRVREAARLGARTVVVPAGEACECPDGVTLWQVRQLSRGSQSASPPSEHSGRMGDPKKPLWVSVQESGT